ncbi:DUF4347 domain-containing protein [Neptunomonas antarctica]|uniref:VCBS repeat-containing protein n=1 Tax=Neptunomonas antarctica TaxID=619304 RepID=A0A1N7J9S8_9GAMM|nr:DUF4347 domain-containing protein [Neptunomonas antarctica]SIS46027.1 VCBS repeat-containing protein [Neptunomonas antarctica]
MKNKTLNTPLHCRRKPLIMALEPRILLDGAAVATTAEMTTDVAYQDDSAQTDTVEQSVHFAAPAPTVADAGNRREVAFVDTAVEDYQSLVDGLGEGVEIILIDGNENGLEQMVTALQGETGIDAIHLFSHGDVGELKLGTLTLNDENLQANAELLSTLGESLSEAGDLMLYGCYVGADNTGRDFVDSVASLTQADVAASEDLTGAESLGGDWDLEASSGVIETQNLSVSGYEHSLVISGWNDQSYTEQQGEIALGNGISITGGDNYGTGYIQFEVTNGKQVEDILSLDSSNNPSIEDQVSLQGSDVYIGQGAGKALLKIGSIDNYLNGQAGRTLRINFDNATIPGTNPVLNGDFSSPFSAGWNAYTSTVDLGVTSFTFSNGRTWVIPELATSDYPSQTPGRDDNDLNGTSYGTYDNGIVQIDGNRLRLEESRLTTSGYGVVHGPAAYSDVFAATKDMVLQFDWEANNIGDDYHVAAYLMNVDTGNAELVFTDYGTRGTGTEFISVSADGNYSFVFVSGTFDKTGGRLAGASMYIDNIRVEEAAITDEVLTNMLLQVKYKNDSDNPSTSKVVTLTAKNINNIIQTDNMTLTVTPVNDPSSLAGNAQLPTIMEDQASNDGRSVSQLFGSLFSDVDNGDTLGGVFITANPLAGDATDGVWEYQVAGSSTWHDVGSVSETGGLLLAADTLIRFNPATDYNGTPDSLSLRGVDQTLAGIAATTDGARGEYNTTAAPASSGLSTQTRTLSINVTSVNDIPEFTNNENSTTLTETSGADSNVSDLTVSPGDVLTGVLSVDDIETDANLLALVIRGGVETSLDSGVWQLSGRYGTLELDTTNNNTWTYTPDKWDAINALRAGQVVTDTFQFKVSDSDGGLALQDFIITLNGVNDTPLVVNALAGQSFADDGSWTWQIPANTFTDAEGTGLAYTAWVTHESGVGVTPYQITVVNGVEDGSAADWLTFDASSRTLSGDPTATWADKNLTIEIRADDGLVEVSNSFTLDLTGTANNQPPVVANEMTWTSIDAQDTSWELQIPGNTFSDADSPSGLSYSANIIETNGTRTSIDGSTFPGLIFDSNTGKLSGDGTLQDLLIEIVATDDKEAGYSNGTASTQFQLGVYDSTGVDGTPATTVTPNVNGITGLLIDGAGSGRYTLPANAFDIVASASNTVTYAAQLSSAGGLPAWLTFDAATGAFTGNPPQGSAGLSIEVTATVDDGVSPVTSGALALSLQVTNPNDPIVLITSPLDDQTVTAGSLLGLTFAAPFTDPDGVLSGSVSNAGVPQVDGITYEAFVVDENGVERPVDDFGLALDQNAGDLTLNGNLPGGYAYLNILLRGTEVDGGTTQTATFTLFLNDPAASGDQDVAAYSANDAGVVTVAGTPTQGQTLTVSTVDDDGLTNNAPSYQWQVSSDSGTTWQDIARSQAQTASLQLTQSEAGKQVRVQSFYTDDSGVFESPFSTAVSVADVDDAGAITIAGSPTVGSVLSSTLSDADGLTQADPDYQWQVSTNEGVSWSNVAGATFSTYQVTSNEGGRQVRVQATYSDDMANNETVTSAAHTIQLGAVAPVAVNDSASVTEAGGVNNATPAATPVAGNVLTNDTDENVGDTLSIANLRVGLIEGFGFEATKVSSDFQLSGLYGQIVMNSVDGSFIYTLDESNSAVQALALAGTLTESFNYSVKDSTELFDVGVLSITINGSNDAPEVVVSTADDVDEAVDGAAQSILLTGTVAFDDVDAGDQVDILSASNVDMAWSGGSLSTDLLALLWSGLSVNETDLSAPGRIGWAYDVSNADLDFLATGETITFSYDITVTDSAGATVTDTLMFTINGSNDTPTVQVSTASDYTEALDGSAQSLMQTGTVSFDDADQNNVLVGISNASNNDIVWKRNNNSDVVSGLPAGLAAQLVSAFSTSVDDAANHGQIAWEFDANALDLDFLNKDDTITFSYAVTVNDEQNAHSSATIGFTIVGTNDAPEVTSRQLIDDETIVQMGDDYILDISTLFSDKDSVQSREDLDFLIEGLPDGLSYDAQTGVISGASRESGKFIITMTAIDTEDARVTRSFELTVTAVVQDDSGTSVADTTPPPPPESDTQPVESPLSGMPDGLVNEDGSADPTDTSGYINSESATPPVDSVVDAASDSGVANGLVNEGNDAGKASEQVILAKEGVLVVESRSLDGKTSVRASVDVNVNDSGEVVFSDTQQEAFGVVSLAVVSIEQTADNELFINVKDTSPSASAQRYSGTLGSGESLPGWLTVDPATGSMTILNPPAGQKEVVVRIQTIDADGKVRMLELKLDLEELLKRNQADNDKTVETIKPQTTFVPLADQLEAELVDRDQYGNKLMALLHSA